ncbi:MAG: S8 family serine peptidase [Ferruginibacter sp.]|nr:S8 family serine peptidase [Ferruginibacter sp.]
MKKLLLFILIFTIHPASFAQYSRYIIQLKDKAGTPFSISNPSQFLSQRAINRRVRYNIPLDQSDLPVTPRYIDSIRLSGKVTILTVSKWLNQVCIVTTDAAALSKINNFSFVSASAPIAARLQSIPVPVDKQLDPPDDAAPVLPAKPQDPTDTYNYGIAYPQIDLHNARFLHNLGFSGGGMQIALMDAGFYHYKTLPTFDSVRNNNQVLGTWDFVANEESVNEDHVHGMNCFSTIAANLPGSFVGTSPKSSFYLFRTEDISSEYPVEEQNWVAAAEKADSLGVDIFSVSLGYNLFDNSSFNYSYAQMDGNTTIISRGCDLAAKKGILVVVAAGNAGNSNWKYITTPADADSVLAVGAVNVARQTAGFSSYGPSADGQVKPDVAAIGLNAVIADQNTGGPVYNNGTSYACPIMAGIVTCLWQAFPEVNNMGIIDIMRKSSDKTNTPDDRTGYGIPDAKKAFVSLLKKSYTGQITIDSDCKTRIAFTVKKSSNMNIVVERKLPTDINYVALTTIGFTGSFLSGDVNYTDDLTGLAAGITIKYRLKMTIAADTSFYLDSVTVNYGQSCNTVTENITIGPNPVTDNLIVLVARNTPVKATVIIHSIPGQIVYSTTQQVSGAQNIIIPMKQMSRGIYFVTVFLNDKKELVKKIVRN